MPLALLDAPWRGDGRIVMLEPRRLAARGGGGGGWPGCSARRWAARWAIARGWIARSSAATRIEVVTEGLLVRRLLGDPGFERRGRGHFR